MRILLSFLITVFALSLPAQSTTLDGQHSLADNIKTLSAQPDKTISCAGSKKRCKPAGTITR